MTEERHDNTPIAKKIVTSEAEEKGRLSRKKSDPVDEALRKAVENIWHLADPPHLLFAPRQAGHSNPYYQWSEHREKLYFTDPTSGFHLEGTGSDDIGLRISRWEFDQLTAKTHEILSLAALAHQRIAKDQEEIDLLRAETREILKQLRAA